MKKICKTIYWIDSITISFDQYFINLFADTKKVSKLQFILIFCQRIKLHAMNANNIYHEHFPKQDSNILSSIFLWKQKHSFVHSILQGYVENRNSRIFPKMMFSAALNGSKRHVILRIAMNYVVDFMLLCFLDMSYVEVQLICK